MLVDAHYSIESTTRIRSNVDSCLHDALAKHENCKNGWENAGRGGRRCKRGGEIGGNYLVSRVERVK